ncbi:maleylpyruvate isomerase family mycothiol-dependent enzyme [Dermacoccaceae bacterium W4C1]
MTIHPLPPQTFDELRAAFRQSAQAVVDLGFTCRDAEFALDTDCPGWSVKDQFAHIAATEAMLAGVRERKIDVPDYPYLHSDNARFVEAGVEVRRASTGPQVIAELQRLIPQRLEFWDSPERSPEEELTWLDAPIPAQSLLQLRAIDLWVHEQDIRVALDRPGNLDSPAAAMFVAAVMDVVGRRAARAAALPIGTVVIVESTGPVTARTGVRVAAGADGRPYGESLFSGESDVEADSASGEVTTVRLTTEALTRLGAGRRTSDQVHWSCDGDEQVGRALLDALNITP